MDLSTSAEVRPMVPDEVIPRIARDVRRPYKQQLAVHLILASILFLFLPFFLLVHHLHQILNDNLTFNWSNSNASTALFILEGTGLISMFVFAIISDSKLGKAKILIIGLPMCLVGYILMTIIMSGRTCLCELGNVSSHNDTNHNGTNYTTQTIFEERCAYSILSALIIIAISAGAVLPNLLAFGADQTLESMVTTRYFDKLIVIINIVNIADMLCRTFAKDQQDYFISYVIVTTILFFAVLTFFIGRQYYTHIDPYDSVITNICPVVINAFHSWHTCKTRNPPFLLGENREEPMTVDERPLSFLDFAKIVYHGKFSDRIVEDVKSFRNSLIIFIIVLPCWFVSSQYYWIFGRQGASMTFECNNSVFDNNAMIFISEQIISVVSVAILNLFVYKYLDARNRSLTIANKFLIGMCSTLMAMCISGVIEILRQKQCPSNQTISNLTVYIQLLPNIGISLTRLFGVLAIYEFAYYTAPRSAQSLFMTFCLLSITMSDILPDASNGMTFNCPSSGFLSWKQINFFFILAGIQLTFIIVFLVAQKFYRIIHRRRP